MRFTHFARRSRQIRLNTLAVELSNAYVGRMKTVTTREFFHSPGLVKAMRPGQSIIVTDKKKPALTVTKVGKRAQKTRADLEREAREIFPDNRPKVDFTAVLRKLKK